MSTQETSRIDESNCMEQTNTEESSISQQPVNKKRYSSAGDNFAESILTFFAYALLIIGIAASIVTALFFFFLLNSDFGIIFGGIILVGGPILSFIIWANIMVLANISNNTRQIKYELREINDKLSKIK
ncbi:MAG: hypothetical protein HDS75_08560 [Bacteroidales bacterium]|nr:hypothetical protein [Bacteroidales bacterium]